MIGKHYTILSIGDLTFQCLVSKQDSVWLHFKQAEWIKHKHLSMWWQLFFSLDTKSLQIHLTFHAEIARFMLWYDTQILGHAQACKRNHRFHLIILFAKYSTFDSINTLIFIFHFLSNWQIPVFMTTTRNAKQFHLNFVSF